MRAGWKIAVAMLVVLGVPRCAQNSADCDHESEPHATFVATSACNTFCTMACDDGFLDCDTDVTNGCETDVNSRASLGETLVETVSGGGCSSVRAPITTIGTCSVICAPGFFDCDGNTSNGCESTTDCGQITDANVDAKDGDAAQPAHEIVSVLTGEPGGLAICGSQVVYFDGDRLDAVDPKTFLVAEISTSPRPPAGGIACDATDVYWTVASDVDGGADGGAPNGALMTALLGGSIATPLAGSLDTGRGIDVRGDDVYFIARSGVADASVLATVSLGDGGIAPLAPANETNAYKVFALAGAADFSLADPNVMIAPHDGGAPSVWVADASASAIFTSASNEPLAVVRAQNDAGDLVVRLTDDAGAPSQTPISPVLQRIITTSPSIVASASTIYEMTALGTMTVATSTETIVFVASDPQWVYWLTRAQGVEDATLWRTPRP